MIAYVDYLLKLSTGQILSFHPDVEEEWGDVKISTISNDILIQYCRDEPDEGYIGFNFDRPRQVVEVWRRQRIPNGSNFSTYRPITLEQFIKEYDSWVDVYSG